MRNERHRMIQKGKTFKTSNCATRCRLYATKALSYDRDFMILEWSLRGLLRGLTRRRWPSTRAARRTTLTDSVARRAGANEAKTPLLVQRKLDLGPYRFFFNIPPACVRILRLSRAPLSACFAANGRPCMLEDKQSPVKKASFARRTIVARGVLHLVVHFITRMANAGSTASDEKVASLAEQWDIL